MSGVASRDFEARFDEAVTTGRVLATSSEAQVAHLEPFVLAAECGGEAIDSLIRAITLFAFALSAIVGTLVLVRAAPRPVAFLAAAWFFPALGARWYARRRRSALGKTLVDFDQGSIEHVSLDGRSWRAPLEGSTVVVTETNDAQAPLYLLVHAPGRPPIRLVRGVERELDRVLVVFRRYKIAIERTAG